MLARQSAKRSIQKGSKSFALASLLFANAQKEAAWHLYAWCRHCDDQVDLANTKEQADRQIEQCREMTESCYGRAVLTQDPWAGFQAIVSQYKIPRQFPMDLLRGCKTDVNLQVIATWDELLDYCYCVAGTVGAMMTHIMGVAGPKTERHAIDLGIAMQLTNIARDVREDFERGRIYIPNTWLNELAVEPSQLLHPDSRPPVKQLVERLLSLAEGYYKSGINGLRFLPWRSRCAVSAALWIYRDIGRQIYSGDANILERRVYVTQARKIWLLALSLLSSSLQPFKMEVST